MENSLAEQIRAHARREYIEPARRRHETTVRIVAGEVRKALRLNNRVPAICQALKSHKFQAENRLILEKWEGPPSGMSTTVAFVYRLNDRDRDAGSPQTSSSFQQLRGIAKDVFQRLGGGEAFLRTERSRFYKADRKE